MSSEFGKVRHSKYSSHSEKPRYRKSTRLYTATAIAISCGILALAILLVWYVNFRPISVEVNGEQADVRIHSSVEDLLVANEYFGVDAGNLISVKDEVLKKGGGTPARVFIGDEEVEVEQFATRELVAGDVLTVKDGRDVYEKHEKKIESIEPEIMMEAGGAIQFVSQWGQEGTREIWVGKQSGETADKGVTKKAEDMVVSSLNPSPNNGKKYVALTFDDGPGKDTQEILDILKEKDVHATFFNLGLNAQNYPDLAKRVVNEGHEMASHTNQHMNLPKQDTETLRNEITSAQERIGAASGVSPQMIRAPYGAFTLKDWQRAGDLISCNVLWNIDTLDWKRPGAATITQTILSEAYNGAIILMHDGGGDRSQDVEALPGIIDGLKEQGYTFVTVTELMELDGCFPDAVVKGEVSVPEGCTIPPVE